MHLVALDTTTRVGSLALLDDDLVVAEQVIDQVNSYAKALPGAVLTLLESVGQELSAIDVFAVARGPGSFTGLRIGIATIQGLAFVGGRRVVPVSALEALAHAHDASLAPGSVVGAWMDGRRGDVFGALYQVTDAPPFALGRLVELEAPSIGSPAETLHRWTAAFDLALLVGDGATLFAALVGTSVAVALGPAVPLAGTVGRMAAVRARAGQTVDPAEVRPLYVRRSDAEIARDLAGRAQGLSKA